MNYSKIYTSLIERGINRTLEGYVEIHHIVPRCIGGTDEKTNLVILTPEEHYLAHQLLVKIYPDNHALVKAAVMMIPNRPSNKLYGWLRRKFSAVRSIEQTGNGNSQFGTMWIYSETEKISKRIKNTDTIPEGWVKGRIINFDSEERPQARLRLKNLSETQLHARLKKIEDKQLTKIKNEQRKRNKEEYDIIKRLNDIDKRNKEIEKYTIWYKLYSEVGFEKFKEETNYPFSQPNFVSRCKALVEDFIPQNGKKRGLN